MAAKHSGSSLECLCGLFGKTRQAYYKKKKTDDRILLRTDKVIKEVKAIRELDPGIGAYKLFLMLHDVFDGHMFGRNRFYSVLGRNGLMLPPQRRRHTTNSNHNYRKYKNLIKNFIATAPNQLWVADITYIDTDEGVMYLHLVTDAFTHEIIGWVLSDSLMAVNTIEALQQAIDKAQKYDLAKLIHHSDRGSQYCSNDYVNLLKSYKVGISMTEDYKPTDNAIAERVNGIIKVEWIYRQPRFKSRKDALEKLARIIDFYNKRRPHMSNKMLTPEQKRMQYEEKSLTGAVCPQSTTSSECLSFI